MRSLGATISSLMVMTLLPAMAAAEWPAGFAAFTQHNCAEAVQEFQEVVRDNDGFAEGHYMLGLAHHECGHPELAADHLARALQIDRKSTIYRIALAQVLLDLSWCEEAFAVLSLRRIGSVEIRYRTRYVLLLARSAQTGEQVAHAVRSLCLRIKECPDDPRLYKELGAAHDRRGDHEAAYSAFKRAWDLEPDNCNSGLAAARSAIASARTQESTVRRATLYRRAARIVERLAELRPEFDSYMLAGEAWLLAGDHEAAGTWLNKASRVKPGNPVVQLRLAQYHRATDELELAQVRLQEALKIGVGTGRLRREVYNELGFVYTQQQRYRLAISAFREAENNEQLNQVFQLAKDSSEQGAPLSQ